MSATALNETMKLWRIDDHLTHFWQSSRRIFLSFSVFARPPVVVLRLLGGWVMFLQVKPQPQPLSLNSTIGSYHLLVTEHHRVNPPRAVPSLFFSIIYPRIEYSQPDRQFGNFPSIARPP